MTRRALTTAAGAALLLALAACTPTPGGTVPNVPDYAAAVEQSNELLAELRGQVPDDRVEREGIVNDDLDRDHHRLSCTDTTSQFTNARQLWLAPDADPVAIIDGLRDGLLAAGWERTESVEERETGEQGAEGPYTQTLRSEDGFGVSLRKWEDAGTAGVSISVFSPCVPNPTDKPDTWGK